MSYRTTGILLILLVALAAYVYFWGSESKESDVVEDRSLQVLNLDDTSIDSMEVKEGNLVTTVRRSAGGLWELVEPERFDGDQSRINSVVFSLAQLNATRVISSDSQGLSNYGLNSPGLEVTIGAKGSSLVKLLIGNQNPSQTGYYLRRSDGDTIYLVGSFSVNQVRDLVGEPPKAKPTPTPTIMPSAATPKPTG